MLLRDVYTLSKLSLTNSINYYAILLTCSTGPPHTPEAPTESSLNISYITSSSLESCEWNVMILLS